MNIGDLINSCGDDVQMQMLDQCADRMNMNKGVTKVTFGTKQPLGLNGFERMGIVVWLDRGRVKDTLAAAKAMSARQSQDRNGLGAKPASAAPTGVCPEASTERTKQGDASHE